jgi:hypothetical protein
MHHSLFTVLEFRYSPNGIELELVTGYEGSQLEGTS